MNSFIIKLDDNKKGKNLIKKITAYNTKEENYDNEEKEKFKDDDKYEQDYIIPGKKKKKNGILKDLIRTKKKKLNKIYNTVKLSSQKKEKD